MAVNVGETVFGGRGLRTFGQVAALLLLVAASILAQETFSKAKPLWSEDVVPYLGAKPAEHYWEDRQEAGLSFLDSDRLLVYYVAHDLTQLSSRESPDISSPFRLRVSLMDADGGSNLQTREWGTRAAGSTIMVHQNGVVVRTGDTVRLVNRDLEELRKLPLSRRYSLREEDAMYEWDIQSSVSGNSILFNHYNLDYATKLNMSHYSVLRGRESKFAETWTEHPALHHVPHSVSDNAIAYVKPEHNRDRVFISEFATQKWKEVWQHPRGNCLSAGVFALLSDDSFVYACKEMFFVSRGRVLMHDEFGKHELPVNGKVSVARDGRYVAISLHEMKIGDTPSNDTLAKLSIVVYDLDQKKRVFAVDVASMPDYAYDFTISPDGSKLAVLNDHNVSVYQVPGRHTQVIQAESAVPER